MNDAPSQKGHVMWGKAACLRGHSYQIEMMNAMVIVAIYVLITILGQAFPLCRSR